MVANNVILALPVTAESVIKIDNSRGGETYEIFHDRQAYACLGYVAENICRTTF